MAVQSGSEDRSVAAPTREAAARLIFMSDETLGPMTGNHERATN